MPDKLRFKTYKKFDGKIDLVEFFLTAVLRPITRNIGNKWFDSEETLFQNKCITFRTCKIELAKQVLPLFMKPTVQIELALETDLIFCSRLGLGLVNCRFLSESHSL